MKTFVLFMLMTASAAVMLSGCKKDKDETKFYTVTVTSVGNGTAVAEPVKAVEGTTITLTATPGDGYLFTQWTVVAGDIVLEDATALQVTFTMPAENVEITTEFLEDIDIFTVITDDVFREYCKAFDTDGDGKLSREEAKEVKEINTYRMDISSLEGIEYFSSLESLSCVHNPLISLDVSKNMALTTLLCAYSELTTLDVSKNVNLTSFTCNGNPLGAIDVSKNAALITLQCTGCQLTTLDISFNTKLEDLNCSENKLTSLDVSKNTLLTWCSCYTNRMSALDLTNMAFDEEGKYTIRCGDQKTASGVSQTLTLTLRDDMKDHWNTVLYTHPMNSGVILAN